MTGWIREHLLFVPMIMIAIGLVITSHGHAMPLLAFFGMVDHAIMRHIESIRAWGHPCDIVSVIDDTAEMYGLDADRLAVQHFKYLLEQAGVHEPHTPAR